MKTLQETIEGANVTERMAFNVYSPQKMEDHIKEIVNKIGIDEFIKQLVDSSSLLDHGRASIQELCAAIDRNMKLNIWNKE